MVKNSIIVGLVGALIGGIAVIVFQPEVNPTPPSQQPVEVGAMASPDNPYTWRSVGGMREWARRKDLAETTSTSTLCSFQSPAATSTLVSATMRIKNTTGTNEFQIGRGNPNNSNSTSTLLASLNKATTLWGELVATTTATALTDGVVIPNSWIVFKVASGTPGVVTWSGDCSVLFREL